MEETEDMAVVKGSMLVVADHVVLPVCAVQSVVRELMDEAIGVDDMLVVTQASVLRELPIESLSLNLVVSILKNPNVLNEQSLQEIIRLLKPGGKLVLQTSVPPNEKPDQSITTLRRKLLLAGFVETQDLQLKQLFPESSHSLMAKKPSWNIGSAFSIKRPMKSLPKVQIADDLDLIDEDSLLTEEDLKKPQLLVVGDCEVGRTRKACKNCTCGRAEAEQKVEKLSLTAEQLNNPQSACGNCGLGDAFRCGSCPYKGLPPFKLGEKVSLGNYFVADV